MNDDKQNRRDEIYREELQKQWDAQAERDFLKDKSVAGDRALRPSDEFIDRNLGKSKTGKEQEQAAAKFAEVRMNREQAIERRQEAVNRSFRDREQVEGPKRGDLKKEWSKAQERKPDRGHGR